MRGFITKKKKEHEKDISAFLRYSVYKRQILYISLLLLSTQGLHSIWKKNE